MTEDEYQNLINEYGEFKAQKCVKELDMYKKSKGGEYADDYSTIKRWVIDRIEEQEDRKNKKSEIKDKTGISFSRLINGVIKEFLEDYKNEF